MNHKHAFAVFTAAAMLTACIPVTVCADGASELLLPYASSNLSNRLRSLSHMTVTDDGYLRLMFDGDSTLHIEQYNDDFDILSTQTLALELPVWGGFYAGKDAYYLIEGQNNTEEDDAAEVFRVIKYDTDWNRLGAATISGNPILFGGQVRYPFDYGGAEMTEIDGTLYIVTAHEGYVDPQYNQGHQGFIMITVDEETMTGSITNCDLWHSFSQYIVSDGNEMYVYEQSEGSRQTQLSICSTEGKRTDTFPVLEYGGSRTSAWAIPCYSSADGVALSDENVLGLGTSIDQSAYDDYDASTAYNLYLTVTPRNSPSAETTTVKWLTSYEGDGTHFKGTKITKINGDRFLVTWQESRSGETQDNPDSDPLDSLSDNTLHYLFVDGSGTPVSEEFTAAASFSDCKPVLKGDSVVFTASNSSCVNFYCINTETGAFRKRTYRTAGEHITWNLEDGVLTVSGTGEIAKTDTSSFSYTSPWGSISDQVNKIVIGEGITAIPENAFNYFDNLTTVEIADTVTSIGKQAFYENNALKKIVIPASVTEIGDDILWTGWYWVGSEAHVVYATIYTTPGSYAETYAKANDISVSYLDDEPVTEEPTTEEITTEEITTEEPVDDDFMIGDVNGDSAIDIMDVISLNKYLLGSASLDDAAKFRADADGNGEVDSTDSLNILKFVVEIVSTLPVL